MSKELMVGYGLIALGIIVAGIALFSIPTIHIIGLLVGAGIAFVGYKVRLKYR